MPRVRLTQPRADCIVLEHLPEVRKATLWALPACFYWLGFRPLEFGSAGAIAWAALGALLLPLATIKSLRSLKRKQYTLVRANGRLLLDGEPLELARVELRVRKMPITKVPTGYDLSLWVMTASGPMDLALGFYRTLIDASRVSGDLEDFVQRANKQQHKHV